MLTRKAKSCSLNNYTYYSCLDASATALTASKHLINKYLVLRDKIDWQMKIYGKVEDQWIEECNKYIEDILLYVEDKNIFITAKSI